MYPFVIPIDEYLENGGMFTYEKKNIFLMNMNRGQDPPLIINTHGYF